MGNGRHSPSGSTLSRGGQKRMRKGVREKKKKKNKNSTACRGDCRKRRRRRSCSRRSSCCCRKSSHNYSGESGSKSSWSIAGSKSYKSFNRRSSSSGSSWKSSSCSNREACVAHSHAVARAQGRGRGTAYLWTTNPRVAPSRGAGHHPGQTWVGRWRCGTRLCYAHTSRSPV